MWTEKDAHTGWLPDQELVSTLLSEGVVSTFIEDAVPEFELHMREIGALRSEWDARFARHIRALWREFLKDFQRQT